MRTPILDNHVHLEPSKGRNVEAVREFERYGGTHIIISHQPYEEFPVREAGDFRASFDVTISLKDRASSETGVRAYATVGPYPVELLGLQRLHGLDRAKQIMLKGMDIAAEYVRDNRALALGEVGRPHFPVPTDVWTASNEIMIHAMRLAKELDCAVVLHTESATTSSMRGLAEMADEAGLSRSRVVKHYSTPLVLPEENFGLMPSVLAGKDALKSAISKGMRFLMETDFLDDPKRPGAVLAIHTVPKRTKALMQQGLLTDREARIIHEDNPKETYGTRFV